MTTARTRIIRTEQDRHAVANELQHLPLNKPWRVVVDFYVPKRSLAQNRLYWLWMTHLGGYLGYSREEMHEEIALMFLEPITYTGLDGEERTRRTSTTKLNVKQFAEYLEQIDRWAISEQQYSLPKPDDLYYEAMGR